MVTPVQLVPGILLSNVAVVYYTAPTGTRAVIKKLTVTSFDAAAAHAFTLWIVPAAGAPANANMQVNAKQIGPLETRDVTECQNKVIPPGATIQAKGDDNVSLSMDVDGIQIV